ncbi:transmembrane amino acid transporter protein, putative [Ichthyophthirius multifiliis]|uniref:Transmembrane amino acid transporter protein, putative n=1 Tax=Ichthyophthirius multifiliis TaxID=5932 RepID=G0QNH8_ICHMU|nr:transmembrane amino acid transporter protein, putative [Ichthyophthirius multifiliis]EGR33226.1 transmembrane amino acid transporter protein, putative [Ichthyophthirius multifiliis]|eukprot:XP_004037212.1 transmembrane amino acid transporter protein, putative [Ichthyophthirius multifiliis]
MIILVLMSIFGYNIKHIKEIENQQYKNQLNNQFKFSGVALIIGVSIYSFEAVGLIFSIRNSLPDVDVHFFQILYALALIMSYPLQLLPAFEILERVGFIRVYINKEQDKAGQWKQRRVFFRITTSIIICLIAYSIPRFAIFLNMLGSVAGATLQFIIPVIMFLNQFKSDITNKKKIEVYSYLFIGVIGGLFAFIFSVIELLNPE